MTNPEEGPLFDAAEEAVSKDEAFRQKLFLGMMAQEQGSRQQEIYAELYDAESERLDPTEPDGTTKWHEENEVKKRKRRRK